MPCTIRLFFALAMFLQMSCKHIQKEDLRENSPVNKEELSTGSSSEQQSLPYSNTIAQRFRMPSGYLRKNVPENSFGFYLRNLNLKPEGSLVHYYDGRTKSKEGIYSSVIDLEIGDKDLHQCADAIMRLRAEYFWERKEYDNIHFNFTNGHRVEYSEFMQGKRMQVDGNKTQWKRLAEPSNTYDDFWNYLELIFMYAGTASLEKELKKVPVKNAEIGDVLIQGGHPGHAVIIVDKAVHKETGKAIFLLAQSYMPAQEIQILINPEKQNLSPWYTLEDDEITTPEWIFYKEDLKRFID